MKSPKRGKSTSESSVEISGVSPHGVWLFAGGHEYFLPFAEFPWFRKATMDQILNVRFSSEKHLEWPDLDVDLHLDSLVDPGRFPLVYRS